MMETDRGYQHWREKTDDDEIRWLTLDKAGSSANTLNREVLAELDRLLDDLSVESPRGLVIQSAKSGSFIAGADIREFEHLRTSEEGAAAAARGQAVLQKLADLPCPSVAIINGHALGGGLELAFACTYRIALESYERCIGLPEVQLGIHPGFGGTVRSVELLGAPLALDLMLSGRLLSPVEASRAQQVRL